VNEAERVLQDQIREGTRRQREVSSSLSDRRVVLPLRFWRQDAHFTTPASNEGLARKAIEGGTSGMGRILDRFGLTGEDLADRLGVDRADVERLLAEPRRAPLVMLDGEDAQALRDDVVASGLEQAARLISAADWGAGDGATLRFFRPPGFALGTSVRDLYTLLWTIARTGAPNQFPLDGIVFPKIEHPSEVDLLFETLLRAEISLGLTPGRIKVAFLIESGWAAAQLPEIAARAASRTCALVFGLADFSADLGLPEISNGHPLAAWARAEIIAVAGALSVPAIDGMTLDYPVSDPDLSPAANRERFLTRMRLVHDDAVQARDLGMTGKWVGHPAQLFAVLLAFDAAFAPAALEGEAAKLEAYRKVVDEGRGATIIEGVMSDRATDRHARVLLRRAVAHGRFDPQRAFDLGVIEPDELAELRTSPVGEAHGAR
jgi:citrate lyase beta subunit